MTICDKCGTRIRNNEPCSPCPACKDTAGSFIGQSGVVKVKCMDCGKVFKADIDLAESPECPRCSETIDIWFVGLIEKGII